jgi:hypothetical protein
MGKGRDKRRRKHKEPGRPSNIAPARGQALAPPEAPPSPFASVRAPLKPKPSLRSGAVALPEPDEPEAFLPELIGVRMSK